VSAERHLDAWVEWEGWRFTAPFRCMCCGVETSAEQFAYGRSCGTCDTGICQRDTTYMHDRPAWAIGFQDRETAIRRFAETVGATRLKAR
jgi:hypothetical protein